MIKSKDCAQWCVIGFVDSVFCYLLEFTFPYWAQYLFGVALIFICYWIAKLWRYLQKRFRDKRAQKNNTEETPTAAE